LPGSPIRSDWTLRQRPPPLKRLQPAWRYIRPAGAGSNDHPDRIAGSIA
jgi:hypothetical protein